MKLIDGKQTAQDLKKDIAVEVAGFIRQYGRRPHLAAVLVGKTQPARLMSGIKKRIARKWGWIRPCTNSLTPLPGRN